MMNGKAEALVKSLVKTITTAQDKKPAPYDTQAEVRRVDGNIAWVHIPGGVDETPVQLTTNAKPGDTVHVRVSGGQAWLYGNWSAPPTDDTTANAAQKTATYAEMISQDALDAAASAEESAKVAGEAAADAIRSAGIASDKADEASGAANRANSSATTALNQLSTVEDVVGVLNWISEHGRYAPVASEETSVVTGKTYYNVTASEVTVPKNKEIGFYYELINGDYILTEDNVVSSGKTYYILTASMLSPVGTENPYELGWYYLTDVDKAVQNYISSHLALTSEGLTLTADNSNYKTLITDGYYIKTNDQTINLAKTYYQIVDGAYTEVSSPDQQSLSTYYEIKYKAGVHILLGGESIAYYGSETRIGKINSFNIKISSSKLDFCNGNNVIAYLSGQELFIPYAVVVSALSIGSWQWDAASNVNHLTLRWIGG